MGFCGVRTDRYLFWPGSSGRSIYAANGAGIFLLRLAEYAAAENAGVRQPRRLQNGNGMIERRLRECVMNMNERVKPSQSLARERGFRRSAL